MAGAGKPIEPTSRQPGQRGPAEKVYRLQDGQTLRLRTNNKPSVMAKTTSGAIDASLPFETENFLGIVFPAEQPNTAVGYCVPARVAARAMRDSFRQWLADDASHSRHNRTRVLRFDGDARSLYRGYAGRWSEYCLGEIELDAVRGVATSSQLDNEIAESKRRIAAAAGRPESAVTITIAY